DSSSSMRQDAPALAATGTRSGCLVNRAMTAVAEFPPRWARPANPSISDSRPRARSKPWHRVAPAGYGSGSVVPVVAAH
ncbi:hypothetical protein, partial [Psychrobacter sp. TB20-MNA-CIBAN-0197]|uniref:hypothetical protein n=1 Tax=Psychrobacter sp. TB20-MNA-CIBAN-0197 TaxID=3140453 RepID=UPI00332F471C